jgi:Protein of unknown function (DUF2750)
VANLSDELGLSPILDVETRIARRTPISQEEFNGLSRANAQQRQEYLINEIVNSHELWTVFDGDELPAFSSSQNDVLHIWPSKEFALRYFSPTISNPHATPIPINDWVDQILFGSQSRNLDLACFPVGTGKIVNMASRETFIELVMNQWRRCLGNHEEFDISNPEGSVLELIRRGQKQSLKSSPKGRLP